MSPELFLVDVARVVVVRRARLVGHGVEVKGGLLVGLDGEPEDLGLVLLAATIVDGLDTNLVPGAVVGLLEVHIVVGDFFADSEAVREDRHCFGEAGVVSWVEGDIGDLLLDVLEELEEELGRSHCVALGIDGGHGEHNHGTGSGVVDLADVRRSGCSSLLDDLGNDGIVIYVTLVLANSLTNVDFALGSHLAGFGIVGEDHILGTEVEFVVGIVVGVVGTEVLATGEGDLVAFERTLKPGFGQVVAEALHIAVVAVEADVDVARNRLPSSNRERFRFPYCSRG